MDKLEIGQEITFVEFFLSSADDDDDKAESKTKYSTCKIMRLSPAFIWLEIQSNKGAETKKFDKRHLLNRIEDPETYSLIKDSISAPQPPKSDKTKYQTYLLSDPRDGSIHYVGISKNVQLRYRQHCQCEGMNLEKNLWIQELYRKGLKPILTIVETTIGLKAAQQREQYWIQHHIALGAPLKNIAIASQGVL